MTGAFDQALSLLPDAVVYWLFTYGSAGVAIFFVISGFVIALSLDGKIMDRRAFVNFVARRTLRLDPPYWAAIVLGMAVGSVSGQSYSASQVLMHMLYMQHVFGAPSIQIVFWTLVYEVQFYLVAVLALVLAHYFPRTKRPVFVFLYLLALASAAMPDTLGPEGLFTTLWHGFVAGVCAYSCGVRRENPLYLYILCGVMIYGQAKTDSVFNAPAVLTGLGLYVAARRELLFRKMPTVLMAAGTISYSLYLTHAPVLAVFAALARAAHPGPTMNWLALVASLGCCIVAASLFYVVFEKPAISLSKNLFRAKVAPMGMKTLAADTGSG